MAERAGTGSTATSGTATGATATSGTATGVAARPIPIPILLYHSVCDDPPGDLERWSVTPRTFEQHLGLIGSLGLQPLTVSQLVEALRSPGALLERPVVVTFDDGYADFAQHALPALERHGIASTIYLTTGALVGVGDPVVPRMPLAPMLALSELPGLERCGVELGAHGHGHWELDALPLRLAAREIERSAEVLAESLGHPIASFAYPHGYSSAPVRDVVVRAGFSSACAVRNMLSCSGDDPFALARLTVEHDTPMSELERWLSCEGARVATPGEKLRTQLWRWYRRAALARERPARTFTVPTAPTAGAVAR